MTVAEVRLWGRTVGAVSWDDERGFAHFEYDPAFIPGGRQVAPLTMPLASEIYSFPALPRQTFHGLPGLLADSLPDRFGNALIDAWLARQGRSPEDFNAVERLCYIGARGMGALEFVPATGPTNRLARVDVAALVELASDILSERAPLARIRHQLPAADADALALRGRAPSSRFDVLSSTPASSSGPRDQAGRRLDALTTKVGDGCGLGGSLASVHRGQALQNILRVGTSAGGARAKAVIAWNPETDEVRSGQTTAGDGFSHWLVKFDGVAGNKDKELDDPRGYGLIEYAYHAMARAAGIEMAECRILREHGRNHFMTRRFDRTGSGRKIHMQSLGAMAHYDFNQAGAYSYEQALGVIDGLGLGKETAEEQFRRMAFNIVARNQDDHVKNIAFLMDRAGSWSLSPAFDVTYSYNPAGRWTGAQQMSLNGKRDDFEVDDFVACARNAALKRGRATAILGEVGKAVSRWSEFAEEAGLPGDSMRRIGDAHRLDILP